MSNITKDGLKNSTPFQQLVTAVVTLSTGQVIKVTNPVGEIIELFQYVENPKNRFLTIGGVMVNISQIASMQWVNEAVIKQTK